MSFWNTLGRSVKGVGNFALDAVKRHNEKVKQHKVDMRKKSESELFLILRSGISTKKIAASQLLKEKGFSVEDIKKRIA